MSRPGTHQKRIICIYGLWGEYLLRYIQRRWLEEVIDRETGMHYATLK
jgi:hypothetical protein